MATIPFERPKISTARRHIGFVDIPDDAKDQPLPFMPPVRQSGGGGDASDSDDIPKRTSLQRMPTMSGSIVLIEDSEKPDQAFWLARKVEHCSYGVTRIGYKLRPNTKEEFKDANGAWELDIQDSNFHPLVTIKMMRTDILDLKMDEDCDHNPLNEIAALQMIGDSNVHLDGTSVVATCDQSVYVVLPYHPDGTLEDFCCSEGRLEESLARFFFRQILKVQFCLFVLS